MHPVSPIIAAIDFSAPSPIVLRHAVLAAKLTNAPVIAVHVLDTSVLSHRAGSGGSNPTMEVLTTQAQERLQKFVDANCPDSAVQLQIRSGRPALELRQAIEDSGTSLLVIAANDLTKKRLGSIASRCVRTAPCDVMVLRDWQDGPFKKLLICTDFSKTAAHALAHAIALAASHGASLEIVHVMYPPSRDLWGTVDHTADSPTSFEDQCQARVEKQMAATLAPHAKALATIPHETVILKSTMPAAVLTERAQDSGADLVVLGTRGQSLLEGVFIGTNTERLLHDATVSVLAIRT